KNGERFAHRPRREVQPAAPDRRRAGRRGVLSGPRPVRTMTRTRIAGIAGAVVLAGLAFQAGEYGTVDWLKLRRQLADERRAVRALEVELDSLARLARPLETSPTPASPPCTWSTASGRFTLADSARHSSTYVSSGVDASADCARARTGQSTQRSVTAPITKARTCGPTLNLSHGHGCTPRNARASTRSRATESELPLLGCTRPSR